MEDVACPITAKRSIINVGINVLHRHDQPSTSYVSPSGLLGCHTWLRSDFSKIFVLFIGNGDPSLRFLSGAFRGGKSKVSPNGG
jgi:hypothetical protein